MEVLVSLATTGEQVHSATFSEIQDQYVWELRSTDLAGTG